MKCVKVDIIMPEYIIINKYIYYIRKRQSSQRSSFFKIKDTRLHKTNFRSSFSSIENTEHRIVNIGHLLDSDVQISLQLQHNTSTTYYDNTLFTISTCSSQYSDVITQELQKYGKIIQQ